MDSLKGLDSVALLVIDAQKAFTSPECTHTFSLPWPTFNNNCSALLSHFRSLKLPIVHVHHHSDTNPKSYLHHSKTQNIQPLDCVKPLDEEPTLVKHSKSSGFYASLTNAVSGLEQGTKLKEVLLALGIKNLILIGISSTHCVSTTARQAVDETFKVWLVDDACLTFGGPVACPGVHVGNGKDGSEWTAETKHRVEMAILQEEFGRVVQTKDVLEGITR
ncbi:Isochorismatase hydrolase [Atractiella rhizophila]|nr:Isochorismatase hydrolase [Atractiella rhizophila]